MSDSGDEVTTMEEGLEGSEPADSEPQISEPPTDSEPTVGTDRSDSEPPGSEPGSEPLSESEPALSLASATSLKVSAPTSERISPENSYIKTPKTSVAETSLDADLLKETSSQLKRFSAGIVEDILTRVMGRDDFDYDEMPGEEDVVIEDLEAPLGDWVTSLIPSREDLEPSFDDVESEPCVTELPPPGPCEPGELLSDIIVSDSPVMKRFQTALKNHLLKQLKRLDEDILEMEAEVKKTRKESAELGEEIYREQLAISKQSESINKYKAGIEEVSKKMKQYDKAMTICIKDHNGIKEMYAEATEKDKKSKSQIDELGDLLSRLNELKQAQLDEMKSSQNLSDKQKLDKMKQAKEKQKQDMLLWKLNKERNKISHETENIIEQAEIKRRQASDLKATVADLEADCTGLIRENHLIRAATEKLFLELSHRNFIYAEASDVFKDMSSQVDQLATHLRSYNKSIQIEIQRRVRLTQASNISEGILEQLILENKKLSEKKDSLLEQVAQLQQLMDAEEATYALVDKESKELFKQQSMLIKEVDQLAIQRAELEKKYLLKMGDLKLQSATLKSLKHVIQSLSQENQDLGLMKLENDCKIGQLMTDIEKTKVEKIQTEVRIDNLRSVIREREADLKVLNVAKKKLKNMILELNSKTLGGKKILEQLVKNLDEVSSESVHVKKIKELKLEMDDYDEKIEELRNSWTEIQNTVLNDNKKLSDVETLLNVTRKQVHVLNHKRHKLEEKERELLVAEKAVLREKRMLEHVLGRYSLEVIRVEEDCDRLADSARETQLKYVFQLKDAEMETVNLQNEISELTDGNADREDEVGDLQRELLNWEKKWTLAVEAKEKLDHEMSSNGEIGAMHREIHRMQVRLSQLHRVQERLSTDLELSVNQRDSIMDTSFARERHAGKTVESGGKQQFEKKLQDLRLRIRQFKMAIGKAKQEVDQLEVKREELMEDYISKRSQLVDAKTAVDRLETDIQEGHLHKYKNLELVVRKQRKIKMLEDIKTNKYRLLHKSESGLLGEEEKQKRNNTAMIDVVDALLSDFPQFRLPLVQIQNTLSMVID